jgi:hypothetical protein
MNYKEMNDMLDKLAGLRDAIWEADIMLGNTFKEESHAKYVQAINTYYDYQNEIVEKVTGHKSDPDEVSY